jgi:nucleoside-diphosphate-sugar epimerase
VNPVGPRSCYDEGKRLRWPLPQDDPVQREPDISLARETLGRQPAVPLREGLLATIEYFDKVLSHQNSGCPANRY